jgi:hypothetical protein
MNTLKGTFGAIVPLLCMASVAVAVLDGGIQRAWARTPDATPENDRRCSVYPSVVPNSAHSRGWAYSDAGLTPTSRTWCVADSATI